MNGNIKVDLVKTTPPQGARIYIVCIKFKQDRVWSKAVKAGGPDTPDDSNVWKVGDLYQPTGTKEIKEDVLLISYPLVGGNWRRALEWARGLGLKNTVPRKVFAIGEEHPNLNDRLGINQIRVVDTTFSPDDNRDVCYVWWHGRKRQVGLLQVGDFYGTTDWFAFC